MIIYLVLPFTWGGGVICGVFLVGFFCLGGGVGFFFWILVMLWGFGGVFFVCSCVVVGFFCCFGFWGFCYCCSWMVLFCLFCFVGDFL